MLRIVNHENKDILKLKRDNMQTLFALQHDIDVEEINFLNEEIIQETNQIKQKIDAMRVQAVKVIEAENQKHLSKVRAEA